MSVGSEKLENAIRANNLDGHLFDSDGKNIRALLAGAPSDLYLRVDELVAPDEWLELTAVFTRLWNSTRAKHREKGKQSLSAYAILPMKSARSSAG